MHTRTLGPFESPPSVSAACACRTPTACRRDQKTAAAVLLKALDLGYTHIDSAALYGFGANETLIGNVLSGRRREFILATKGGMFRNAQGQREIDGRPEMIKRNCDESLQRLKTDVIDLYYLHRWDKRLPIEESVGALADLVKAGKVKAIGLSEVSATTLRKAHAVHPITARQTEYSLWTRNAEVAVLDTCRELGITFVAFSPIARGFFGRRDSRRVHVSTEGHPPGDAPLSGRALRAETCRCSTGCRQSPAMLVARWRKRHSHGFWRRASTSFRSPARRDSITSKRTPAPNRCGSLLRR